MAPALSPVARTPLQRRTLAFILIGFLAYLLGIIALIPARALISDNDTVQVGGTIWRGHAVYGSVMQIDWTFAPITTLMHLAYSVDWHMTGGATDLTGSASRGGGTVRLEGVVGRADGTLLAALAPRLPIDCRFLADVAIDRVVIGGLAQQAAGAVMTSPVSCTARGLSAASVQLPALRGEIAPSTQRVGGTSGALMTAMRRESLVEVRLTRAGALSVWPTPNAVRIAPFLAGQRYDTQPGQ